MKKTDSKELQKQGKTAAYDAVIRMFEEANSKLQMAYADRLRVSESNRFKLEKEVSLLESRLYQSIDSSDGERLEKIALVEKIEVLRSRQASEKKSFSEIESIRKERDALHETQLGEAKAQLAAYQARIEALKDTVASEKKEIERAALDHQALVDENKAITEASEAYRLRCLEVEDAAQSQKESEARRFSEDAQRFSEIESIRKERDALHETQLGEAKAQLAAYQARIEALKDTVASEKKEIERAALDHQALVDENKAITEASEAYRLRCLEVEDAAQSQKESEAQRFSEIESIGKERDALHETQLGEAKAQLAAYQARIEALKAAAQSHETALERQAEKHNCAIEERSAEQAAASKKIALVHKEFIEKKERRLVVLTHRINASKRRVEMLESSTSYKFSLKIIRFFAILKVFLRSGPLENTEIALTKNESKKVGNSSATDDDEMAKKIQAIKKEIESSGLVGEHSAKAFIDSAKKYRSDIRISVPLALMAAGITERHNNIKWLILFLFSQGEIRKATKLVEKIDTDLLSVEDQRKIQNIKSYHHLLCNGYEVKTKDALMLDRSNKIIYFVSSSLPHHISGYTTRSHSILTSLKGAGVDIMCVARPGYPEDRADSQNLSDAQTVIDGIKYSRVDGRGRFNGDLLIQLEESQAEIEEFLIAEKPAVVQVASNYEIALPVIAAAKAVGVPVIYEVRGFWEYTASSKRPGWERADRFELDMKLETLCCAEADSVFTLTTGMAEEISKRTAGKTTSSLIPNAIAPDVFRGVEHDEALKESLGFTEADFVIGYVGSIVGYEGLDDLISALSILADEYKHIRLVIVGDGQPVKDLKKQAAQLNLTRQVAFVGRVAHNDVDRYFSIIDMVCLPRKAFTVCELVSPLKPLEAMALGIPVLVSSVKAMAEMIVHKETGLIFEKDNIDSLCESITFAVDNPKKLSEIAANAKANVLSDRTWTSVLKPLLKEYEVLA